MRLYAMFCYAAALFYCATAIQAMSSGVVAPLRGNAEAVQRRDDPASSYSKFLFARWLLGGGLAALGVLMTVMAAKFEKLEDDERKK
jgi:hypothetical protein